MKSLAFTPDVYAQNMRRKTTKTIGIIVRDITVPAFAAFVRAAQKVFYDAGYVPLIMCSEDRKDLELEVLSVLERRKVDGLMMTTCSELDADLLAAREALEFPVLLIDRESQGSSDSILLSHGLGIKAAIDHLVDLGHTRIALMTGSSDVYPGRSRRSSYQAALEARQIAFDPALVRTGSFDEGASFVNASILLNSAAPPTALIVGGINMLASVLRAVRSLGLRVPDDLSLVNSGDSDLAMLLDPPVTTIRWDYSEQGRAAAGIILDRLRGPADPAPRKITFPTEFIVRSSCAAPPNARKPRP
jgi:LacI family transcriptional regulator